jgi:hypothetical protein
MEDVRKSIQFIDSDYKELFRIKDGDSINITRFDGEEFVKECRWIDECHTKIGSDYYHIKEFAERMEKNGNKYEAVPGKKPVLHIIAAKYGEPLRDWGIPMTDAAIRKLIGGNYNVETLYNWDKKYIFGAVLRGKNGIAGCGLGGENNDILTSLHPYNAQTYKRDLSPAAPPAQDAAAPKKSSVIGGLEEAKAEAAEYNAANKPADRPKGRGEQEVT